MNTRHVKNLKSWKFVEDRTTARLATETQGETRTIESTIGRERKRKESELSQPEASNRGEWFLSMTAPLPKRDGLSQQQSGDNLSEVRRLLILIREQIGSFKHVLDFGEEQQRYASVGAEIESIGYDMCELEQWQKKQVEAGENWDSIVKIQNHFAEKRIRRCHKILEDVMQIKAWVDQRPSFQQDNVPPLKRLKSEARGMAEIQSLSREQIMALMPPHYVSSIRSGPDVSPNQRNRIDKELLLKSIRRFRFNCKDIERKLNATLLKINLLPEAFHEKNGLNSATQQLEEVFQ